MSLKLAAKTALRLGGPAALALTLVVALPACSTTPPRPTTSQSAQSLPESCGDFLRLSAAKRVSTYAHTKSVRVYTANGFERETQDKIYSQDCGSLPSSDALVNPLVDAQLPSCALYQTLAAPVQQKWLDAISTNQSYGLSHPAQGPELVTACNAFNAGNMIAASNYLKSFGSIMAWQTTSKLGYKERLVLGVQSVLSGKNIAHPADTKFIAGVACGFDPAKDAAIPLRLFVENSTKKQAQPLAAKFELDITDAASLTTTAYLEANYNNGPVCSSAADAYGTPASVSVSFNDTSKAGESVESSFFVIVKNYFSPRYPKGAAAELASYELRSDTQVISDDPIEQSMSVTLNLDGSK